MLVQQLIAFDKSSTVHLFHENAMHVNLINISCEDVRITQQ